jgi:nicotinamide-nucleotide amidase
MHAEILAIGDEITSGQLLDTNSQWLSQRLEELGVPVLYHTTVGDELAPAVAIFQQAIERADLIVATGGLGPTADDLTRQAIAAATACPLLPDAAALEHIRGLFARRQRAMPKQNEIQALFPAGSRIVPNPDGTAPGIDLDVPRPGKPPCRIVALPGVPAEMEEMWHGTVAEALRSSGVGQQVTCRRNIKCFGAGESQIESMLPDLIRRGRTPTVGINASKTTIILRIAATGPTADACAAAMEPTVATIRQCLGPLVYGEGNDELQDVVVRLLGQRRRTLATVEIGTAGLVADWLGAVADVRGIFLGGIVAPAAGPLAALLGITPALTAGEQLGSEETVGRLAVACRQRFAADYALAVGPFPSFRPAATEPAPVRVALAAPEGVRVRQIPFAGHPATLKFFCAKHALNLLRLSLIGPPT